MRIPKIIKDHPVTAGLIALVVGGILWLVGVSWLMTALIVVYMYLAVVKEGALKGMEKTGKR